MKMISAGIRLFEHLPNKFLTGPRDCAVGGGAGKQAEETPSETTPEASAGTGVVTSNCTPCRFRPSQEGAIILGKHMSKRSSTLLLTFESFFVRLFNCLKKEMKNILFCSVCSGSLGVTSSALPPA